MPRFAATDLSGRRVEEVVARGKHLLFRIEGGATLHTHFKMEGSWHLYRHGEPWRGPGFEVRAVLETKHHVAVGFRLGIVEFLATSDEQTALGHLGPDVLGPDWDADEALRRMTADPERAIGSLLLDQTVVAGPGNVYRSEICFLRGVHPWMPVGDVEDVPGLIGLLKRSMEANRRTGNQITTGIDRPGERQWVYGRAGRACRRCGSRIERGHLSAGPGTDAPGAPDASSQERVVFWCPTCQPAAPPTVR